jgi:hypothetical protein
LGSVAYDRDRSPFLRPNLPVPQERSYSEDTAHAVDATVRTLVEHALERAAGILQRNRALLDRTAVALLETETLNEPDIEKLKQTIVRDGPVPDAAEGGSDGAHRVTDGAHRVTKESRLARYGSGVAARGCAGSNQRCRRSGEDAGGRS